jgi:hypothetical protein
MFRIELADRCDEPRILAVEQGDECRDSEVRGRNVLPEQLDCFAEDGQDPAPSEQGREARAPRRRRYGQGGRFWTGSLPQSWQYSSVGP